MHGIGPQALVDQIWPHDFRSHTGLDVFFRKAPGSVFRQQQLADAPLRIGQGRNHRVPAVQHDRIFGSATVAPAPETALASVTEVLAAGAGGAWFSVAISHGLKHGLCHGFPIMAIWPRAVGMRGGRALLGGRVGLLDRIDIDRRHWLTLPQRFAHKRAQPGAFEAQVFSAIDGLISAVRQDRAVERGSVPSGKGS